MPKKFYEKHLDTRNYLKYLTLATASMLSQNSLSYGDPPIDHSKIVAKTEDEYRTILDAIRFVESGNFSDPSKAVGDQGKAIGPYQIWQVYWKDAVDYDKSIGGKYEDVVNKEYAEKIIRAYWRRYAPKNATFEQLAAIHNAGPNALKKWEKTEKYRKKVMDYLTSKNKK